MCINLKTFCLALRNQTNILFNSDGGRLNGANILAAALDTDLVLFAEPTGSRIYETSVSYLNIVYFGDGFIASDSDSVGLSQVQTVYKL